MATYYGETGSKAGGSGATYTLASRIGHGSEGDVYAIDGQPEYVAKIYADAKYVQVTNRHEGRPNGQEFMHAKVREMVRLSPVLKTQQWASYHSHSFLAWPTDTLVDASGSFCGYVMPRVRGTGNLYGAVDDYAHDSFFGPGNYTWKTAIKIAKQLAFVTGKLHEAGIVIGDFNPQNYLLDRDGLVSFVDIDSYTISPSFKTLVAFPGLVAPELQGKPWSKKRNDCQFTKESDDFSLACLIFQLLTGEHPFNAVIMKPGMASVSQSSQELNIRNGDCPYVKHGIVPRKASAPDVFGLLLPDYLRILFIKCFDYTSKDATSPERIKARPTAAEWYAALDKLDNERMRQCRANPQHYYLPGAGVMGKSTCPWCERDEYTANAQKKMSHGASSAASRPAPSAGSTTQSPAKGAGTTHTVASQQPVKAQSTGPTPSAARPFITALKWIVGIVILLLICCLW